MRLPLASFRNVTSARWGSAGPTSTRVAAEIVQNFEVHDAGNCPLWQVSLFHSLGLLSQSFVARILRPQHVIEFDSCDLTSERTGNALIVLFSEATGLDTTEAAQKVRRQESRTPGR